MAISLSSPVTGGTMSQFTTPTYTVVSDTPGVSNSKAWVITATGGTQTNVRAHSVSDPFTYTVFKPVAPKALPTANPVTGRYPARIETNDYGFVTRKGVNYAANQAPVIALNSDVYKVPVGSDSYDSVNVRALVCFKVGATAQLSQGIADTLVNGVL
jgi:hypothetical protein